MASVGAAWVLIAAMGGTVAVVMRVFGLTFDWPSAALPATASVLLLAGAGFYRFRRPDARIATTLESTALLIVFSAVAAALSYAVAAFDNPYWDNSFTAWDRALGLNWTGYLSVVAGHPWLAAAYGVAYASLMPQLVAATLVLGFSGRLVACRRFVLAVILAGFATVAISAFMPALSCFIHFGLPARDYSTLDLTAAFDPYGPLNGLRAGTLKVISLTGAEGIIAFPSFHAALGVIFAMAFWRVRWMRWPGLALNGLLIASTPINGGHYFVDVLAGIMVALASLFAARALQRSAHRVALDHAALRPAALARDPQSA
jgi:hypothetical protein